MLTGSSQYNSHQTANSQNQTKAAGKSADDPVVFFPQTIGIPKPNRIA